MDCELLDMQCKAMSSPVRRKILRLLKTPLRSFPANDKYMTNDEGVCVDTVVKVIGLAQSTVSVHLQQLEDAGFITSVEMGKWRYVRRHDEALDTFFKLLSDDLQVERASLRARLLPTV